MPSYLWPDVSRVLQGDRWSNRLYTYLAEAIASRGRAVEYSSTDKGNGTKHDDNKPPLYRGLLATFPKGTKAVALLSKYGASKYDWDNWRKVPDGQGRYTDAMLRHLTAEEEIDPECGLPHAVHVAWNALARLELILEERNK